MTCRHLEKADEAEAIAEDGTRVSVALFLCAWARNEQPELLDAAPRWVQRSAMSGDGWRQGDCDGCSCFRGRDQ